MEWTLVRYIGGSLYPKSTVLTFPLERVSCQYLDQLQIFTFVDRTRWRVAQQDVNERVCEVFL